MPVATDEARRIARLAGLRPDGVELEAFASQISAIVDHFGALRGVDVSEVAPTGLVLEIETAFRKDVPGDPLDLSSVLRAAPEKDGSFVAAPLPGVDR